MLVVRHVDALPRAAQEKLAAYLTAPHGGGPGTAARVVATTTADLPAAAREDRFDAALAGVLAASTVAVPRLSDRKVDVLPLVRLFLAARSGGGVPVLAQDAEHAFVSRRYRNRNVAELREAVELAADFAGAGEIRAEHIFAGPKSEAGPAEADLGGTRLAAWLIRPGTLTWLRRIVLASFAAVIGLSLAAPHRAAGRIANAVIWGVWEPAIIAAFLLAGRVWCTVCPLSTAGQLGQRLLALRRAPPGWLKRAGIWLGTVGFFAILWVERVFHMTSSPLPSGVLLLVLMGTAAAFAVVYQRETWCRYVCPLGTLAAGYALPAPLQVRANPSLCATYCTDHACYKGAGDTPGCSVFHHPLFASEGHQCKLCFNCVHVCPHGSAKLYAATGRVAARRPLGGDGDVLARGTVPGAGRARRPADAGARSCRPAHRGDGRRACGRRARRAAPARLPRHLGRRCGLGARGVRPARARLGPADGVSARQRRSPRRRAPATSRGNPSRRRLPRHRSVAAARAAARGRGTRARARARHALPHAGVAGAARRSATAGTMARRRDCELGVRGRRGGAARTLTTRLLSTPQPIGESQ